MTAFESISDARRTLAELRDVPADVLAQVLDADLSLSIAAALLVEARVVAPTGDAPIERIAGTYR